MKIAIIGSRNLEVNDLENYVFGASEIVSGGARGIDTCAEKYASEKGIKLKVFLPDYKRYGKGAPLKRNLEIIEYADRVIAFWDGKSRGTKFVIDQCEKINKPVEVVLVNN